MAEMEAPKKKKHTIFRKHSLRTRDDQVTKASELSMREALLPVCLVTILFFLWVSCTRRQVLSKHTLTQRTGSCIWPPRHPEQALPDPVGNIASSIIRSSSSVLRCLSCRVSWLCQLDPTPFRLQSRLHVRPVPLRYRCTADVARCNLSFLWWLLRCHLHHR